MDTVAHRLARLRTASRIAGVLAFAVGVLVLVGWITDTTLLKSLRSGWATMKANTALGFLFAGASLWLLVRDGQDAKYKSVRTTLIRWLGLVSAVVVLAIGALTLIEYLLTIDLGLDQFFFPDPETPAALFPGRMAPATAFCFLLCGSALTLIWQRADRRTILASQIVALAGEGFSLLAIFGYAYGVRSLYKLMGFSSVSLHTAVTFAILFAGILWIHGGAGLMAVVHGNNVGSRMARKLLPVTIVVPALFGWLITFAERHSYLSRGGADTAALALLTVLFVSSFVWFYADVLNRADRERSQLERDRVELLAQLKGENEDLAALTRVTANAISTLNLGDLLEVLLQRIVEVTRADVAIILLTDSGGRLQLHASRGLAEDEIRQYAVPGGKGFAEAVARERKPLHIDDAQQDFTVHPVLRGRGVRTMLGVPLKRDGNLIGVLHVDWLQIHPLRDREVHILEITAERCAAAILNAQLYETAVEAEAARRASEEQYRLLFASNPHPMWVYDMESLRFLEVNDAAMAHYGYSRDEFLAMTIKEIRSPEDLPALVQNITAVKAGLDKAGIWRHRKKDGTIIDVEITSHFLHFAGRKAEVVLANDVTERIRAEHALRRSEERFEKAFQASPEPITISTIADGRYVDVNQGFLNVTGYAREEVVGHLALDVFWTLPRDRDSLLQALREHGTVRNLEIDFKTKSEGTRRGLLSAEIFELDGQQCVLSVTKDITEHKRLEQQFRQAQKMEAIGQLAGGVAHDFNNLLMVILSYCDLLVQREPNSPTVRSYCGQIISATQKAAALTRQLLAFSRRQVLTPSVLDVNKLVTDIGKMLPRLIGEDIEMTFWLGTDIGRVEADPSQIEQVIFNLAVNARDAMPRGGKLSIETAEAIFDEEYCRHHSGAKPGRYVMLSVTDTGIGMNKEIQARVFEPFFTTKEPGKGTGLGLATVYGIVKQSGGFIWVYSEPGEGTAFKVYLPRVGKPILAEDTDTVQEIPGGAEAILLVEDEEGLRTATREFLDSKGYTVLAAGNAAEALALGEERIGSVDLVVTDVIMPGLRGPDLVSLLKKKHPEAKVIYMSGYPEGTLDVREFGPGAIFLQKPFSLATLAQKLREALGKRS